MTDCTRAWEVEAARDGRLSGHERLSLLRHVSLCPQCTREQERLDALARALRALPVRSVDELTARRQRQALLARAREDQPRAPRIRLPRRRLLVLGGLVACGLFVLAVWPAHVHERSAARLAVMPDAGARYVRWADDGRHVVELKHGRLTLEVERFESDYGVLVRTPDGEIEDIGTVFSVTVREGRTEAISVIAGRVVARIAGRPQRDVVAGETLRPYGSDDLVRPDAARPASNAKPPARVRRARDPSTQSTASPRTSETATAIADSEAARQFSLAVARVEAHDDAKALSLLQRFALQFPGDSRAEDAAYLRVVVLARGSDRSVVRAAARAYLDAYPRGFRAPEVSRLLARDAGL